MSYKLFITLDSIIFSALGQASMCWSETPKGIFESDRAVQIGNDTVRKIENMIDQIIESDREKKALKVCTGCGRYSDDPIGENYGACCPDNRYLNIKDAYLELNKLAIECKDDRFWLDQRCSELNDKLIEKEKEVEVLEKYQSDLVKDAEHKASSLWIKEKLVEQLRSQIDSLTLQLNSYCKKFEKCSENYEKMQMMYEEQVKKNNDLEAALKNL